MSNEVKTKEKVDMDPKYIIKLTVTLFVATLESLTTSVHPAVEKKVTESLNSKESEELLVTW